MKQKILIFIISFLITFLNVYSQKKDSTLNCLLSFNALATNNDEVSCNFSYNQYGELLSIIFITSNKFDNSKRKKYTYHYDVANKKIYEVNENWKNNQWVPWDKMIYDLNGNNNIVKVIYKLYYNDEYIDKYIHYYTYDKLQNLKTITRKRLINNQMQNDSYEYYGYDDNNNLVYYLYRVWFGKWDDLKKIYYHYNEQNIPTKKETYEYYIDDNVDNFEYLKRIHIYSTTGKLLLSESVVKTKDSTFNYKKNEYEYDSNDNLILSIYYKNVDNEWKIQSQTENVYDINNNLISRIYKKNIGGVLTPVSKKSYAYDSRNNLIMDMYSMWENNSWVNKNLITYSFDNNNNMLVKISQTWSENKWENQNRVSYEYNKNNNMTKAYSEIWYDEGMNEKKWIPSDIDFKINIYNQILANFNEKRGRSRTFYTYVKGYVINLQYQDVTSNEEALLIDNNLTLFPNPATDYIEIKSVIPAAAGFDRTAKLISRVNVYDVLGNMVLSLPCHSCGSRFRQNSEAHLGEQGEIPHQVRNDNSIKIDVSSLSPGVYFVRVDNKMYKFVKL